jgi:hypothetical protein
MLDGAPGVIADLPRVAQLEQPLSEPRRGARSRAGQGAVTTVYERRDAVEPVDEHASHGLKPLERTLSSRSRSNVSSRTPAM